MADAVDEAHVLTEPLRENVADADEQPEALVECDAEEHADTLEDEVGDTVTVAHAVDVSVGVSEDVPQADTVPLGEPEVELVVEPEYVGVSDAD